MQINQIQSYSPNFNAKFANDKTTKKVLRDITHTSNDIYDLRNSIVNMELLGVDGEISLEQRGYQIVAHSTITNEDLYLGNPFSTDPLKNLSDIIRNEQDNNHISLFGTEKSQVKYASKTVLINRSKDMFIDKTNQKKFDKKMRKTEDKINELKTEKIGIDKKIDKLKSEKQELIRSQRKKEVDYLISLIG